MDPEAVGDADTQACLVRFRKSTWGLFGDEPELMCMLVVHEVGHLYGRHHVKGTVMDDQGKPPWFTVPPCRHTLKHREILVRGGITTQWLLRTKAPYRPTDHDLAGRPG
jgi:hypothetical protein